MKKLSLIFVSIIACCLLAILWWSNQILPVSLSSRPIDFIITKNQTASQITDDLKNNGLIRSSLAARIYLKWSGLDQKLQAGTYSLSPNQDLKTLLNSLTHGAKDIWVTIPEGWRREQIAARFQANLKDFDADNFISQTAHLEGQLFPDTYLVPITATSSDVITIMTENFSHKTKLQIPQDKDILIMASLVERETRHSVDRPLVAGILFKRLRAGWALNIDATLQYALGSSKDWWPTITNTKVPSLYNTYTYPGLPPTPIANPGLASINAALHPQDSPYWFYLTDSQGITRYSRTLEEHNLNVDKYLKN